MRYDNGSIYAPDLLAFPVVYPGDPAINGVLGKPSLATLNDVWTGGGDAVGPAQDYASAYGAATAPPTAAGDDPCARYDRNSASWWACKAADIGTGGIGGAIGNKAQDAANSVASFGTDIVNRAGLFLLALLVLGVGLWATLK